MMVTFVSQCEKNALKKTRRVLDAFANRIGDNTWQTVITEDGLITVKKMLRQTATKSTAVSCHWIRSRSRSQFLWVVGNRRKFNSEGHVAVNYTKLNLDHKDWENGWELNEAIVLATGIAGLFHDFGKANDLFQRKLTGETKSKSEPFRHEWVSLRLFEALVKKLTDQEWLTLLLNIQQKNQAQKLEQQIIQNLDTHDKTNPFRSISAEAPFAKLVAWLIVSHHRLPMPCTKDSEVSIRKDKTNWLATNLFNCFWNSKNAENLQNIEQTILQANWQFSQGTPLLSETWQEKARSLAKRALKYPKLTEKIDWLNLSFVSHLSRLSLMLADHYYSSLGINEVTTQWQDGNYKASANTDRKTNQLKQKLDEHNIGVAHNAYLFAKNLPVLKYTLPAIAQHRLFNQSAKQAKYRWQDKAFSVAKEFAKVSEKQGFFGINMASTGCGKTIANARIMYALADKREGCRFSVALGLRTLTLQTGNAYRDLLKLSDDELAVLIGSNAIKQLHELNEAEKNRAKPNNGSESSDDLFEQLYVDYSGQIYDGRLRHWLQATPKLEQMISAPIVVSTIDHLMPATESTRGGKQIAPMLRLLTSDLILDEPDDFGLEDLPALCRLVNWAGMLGSRVLLSSATLPPALIDALYHAYVAGRAQFNRANYPEKSSNSSEKSVVCAWFDENNSDASLVKDHDQFIGLNQTFVQSRLKKLKAKSKALRKGKVVTLPEIILPKCKVEANEMVYHTYAEIIYQQIHQLHNQHHVEHPGGKRISLGVVRMANINPMVAVAKFLLTRAPQTDYQFHFCIYHSQFPLALRSFKEVRLDSLLTRHNPEQLWQQPEITNAIKGDAQHHVFIVMGTSVVEVGRDHDYDWAIAEPSSLRSIIQLAGRVQRHRELPPSSANLTILNKNVRAMKGDVIAYCKPGFESSELPLVDKDLNNLLNIDLDDISAIPRIEDPELKFADLALNKEVDKYQAKPASDFTRQEHRALRASLDIVGKNHNHPDVYNADYPASLWWRSEPPDCPDINWSAVLIKVTEFRKSDKQDQYVLRLPEDEPLTWSQLDETKWPAKYIAQTKKFTETDVILAQGCTWWFEIDAETIFENLADKLNLDSEATSEKFGVLGLRAPRENEELKWHWHQQLGVYSAE